MAVGKLADTILEAAKRRVRATGVLHDHESFAEAVLKEEVLLEEEFDVHGSVDGADCSRLKEHKYFLNSCPFCGSGRINISPMMVLFDVECQNCHAKITNLSSAKEASRRWNKRDYHGEKARLAIFNAVRIADRIDEHLGDAKSALQDISEILEAARASAHDAEAAISQCSEEDK